MFDNIFGFDAAKIARTHYTKLEELARAKEAQADKHYQPGTPAWAEVMRQARTYRLVAAERMKLDLEIDAEEKAVAEGTVLRMEDYNALSTADKLCWNMRLKEFKHYKISDCKYWVA